MRAERGAYPQRYQEVVNRRSDRIQEAVRDFGEEVSKGKSVACVALDCCGLTSCRCVEGRTDAVEAQVRPGDEEAERCQKRGSLSAEDGGGDGIHEEKDSREVLDAHTNESPRDGDGVFWDELLERDEEGDLEGNGPRNRCSTKTGKVVSLNVRNLPTIDVEVIHCVFASCHVVVERVEQEAEEIRDDGAE